jgi:hypothetical protein
MKSVRAVVSIQVMADTVQEQRGIVDLGRPRWFAVIVSVGKRARALFHQDHVSAIFMSCS